MSRMPSQTTSRMPGPEGVKVLAAAPGGISSTSLRITSKMPGP
jgi:hypothetical protein